MAPDVAPDGSPVAALINDPSRDRRVQLLDVCARHVAPNGVVVVQRLALERSSRVAPPRPA